MQRLLIGSSNVYRTYEHEKFKGYPQYRMVKCTKFEAFKAIMDDIREEKEVIIAVIENFLCDSVRDLQESTPDLIDNAIKATITDFMKVIHKTATKLPRSRFALVQPIKRPRHEWYEERYDGICRTYNAETNALGLENVSKLEVQSKKSQTFLDDQVHLNTESGKTYVNEILYYADNLFTAEIIDLEEGTSNKSVRISGKSPPEISFGKRKEKSQRETEHEKSVFNLDKKIDELNQDMFRRRFNDSLVMARLREDVDAISNISKEDKLVISGMTSKTPRPTGKDETGKWLKNLVSEVLNSIEDGIASEIIFVSQGRSNNRDIPLAEVRMSSREIALRLRKTFAQKKKSGQNFGKVYLSNCVTLATRVRIEIMKAMAKKFSSDREDIFVMGYTSRPVLHVKPKIEGQRSMWLSFSDALLKYGSGLREQDLGESYRKTGVSFRGQLEQNFVVLHDQSNNEKPPPKEITPVLPDLAKF